MTDKMKEYLPGKLHIIWTIASKDIVDATRTKLVLSLIIALAAMLLLPKTVGLLIDLPFTELALYDPGGSWLAEQMEASDRFRVHRASSLPELEAMVSESIRVEIGLVVPPGFDHMLAAGELPQLAGHVAWANRLKGREMADDLEQQLTELLGRLVHINIEGNIVTQTGSGRVLGMLSATAITIIITVGTSLVPHLMFEEKRTKTMEALLLSPASIGQVITGKALAGAFYVLVAAGVMFAVNWAGVAHWWIALLFSVCSALFAVAMGLLLGSLFDSSREISGSMAVIILALVAPLYAEMVSINWPEGLVPLIPWIPSVALSKVYRFSFSGSVNLDQLWLNLGIVLGAALLLYAGVIWAVRRSDR